MNRPPSWLLWSAALGCALLSVAAGTLKGALGATRADRGVPEASAMVGAAPRPDAAVTLRTLGNYNHWGRYRAPALSVSKVAPTRQVSSGAGAQAVARNYRLVGIEGSGSARSALLLPLAASRSGVAELLQLRVGDSVIDGVTVASIAADAISVQTSSGSATLHLYGNPQ
ncbi:MAG: hypothetical protein IPG20_10645 [Gammaproteobacteria bacterium]|nr:hypothetical protein [Gammaproteobacteria bacterium]